MTRLAIVGMGCRFPDAASPQELWENVLSGRRAFRRLPDQRMRLEDYWSPDPAAPDRFYARTAAVIDGYEFDRVRFQIPGSTYRSTDLTHWLALDVAARALADAGFPEAEGMPRERTTVVVGNTLTGEFTRAGTMRLRWPYVRRTLAVALQEEGWDDDRLATFLRAYEQTYKSPFAPIDEDSLAGGLSNTIAGRICNYFDFNGGGFTVDGACSSSLLSLVTAGKALTAGEADVAIAGGVDISIDPFEMIGFAKTGALAKNEMRVYDRGSNGFWPGEGCGMVVLMREDDALAEGRRIYARVAGWGISSDGKGGITRPEVSGYRLALRRAYQQAGFGVETVALFEGHGTGTAVGDATELKALSSARQEGDPQAPAAAIGTIKGMIGHTKAAAGMAGLIKAVMAVHHEVLPPTTGCADPHEEFGGERPALRVVRKAEPWPQDAAVRSGVTAMGFGGINTHVVLEGVGQRQAGPLDLRTRELAGSVQDAELLLVDASSLAELRERLTALKELVLRLSYAELADLGARLQQRLGDLRYRAAAVVGSPEDAERKLGTLATAIDEGRTDVVNAVGGIFLGDATGPARIGYLFPGQGSGSGTTGGALSRRFAQAEEAYDRASLPVDGDTSATAIAQPRIVTGSMAGLRVLAMLGVRADVAVGHSLGEITALHWAGAMDEDALLRVATDRGAAMTGFSETGAMAGISADAETTRRLVDAEPVALAGYNGPNQTVVAGRHEPVKRVCRAAEAAGIGWATLKVSHAFHSPLMAPSAEAFATGLAGVRFAPLARSVVSTVTGGPLAADADIPGLLRAQIVEPVRFAQALTEAAVGVDLFLEVGPGRVLTGMARDLSPAPVVAIDTDDESLAGFLSGIAAVFVRGGALQTAALFAGRFVRPFDGDRQPAFFASPCEAAPQVTLATDAPAADPAEPGDAAPATRTEDSLTLLRKLAAERVELPIETVTGDTHPLDDLHLSSITVGQMLGDAARGLGLPTAQLPLNFAVATLQEIADALDALADTELSSDAEGWPVAGVEAWVRPFAVDLVDEELSARPGGEENGEWEVLTVREHPLAAPLKRALEAGGVGGGVLVCLPADCAAADLDIALTAARTAMAAQAGHRLVLIQDGRGASGLVKTAHLEMPGLRTTIVDTPPVPEVVDRIVTEVAGTHGFSEASYDRDGVRRVPVLRPLPVSGLSDDTEIAPVLGDDDVLLVTGGGKGITAESALALAAGTGARVAILGRSDPDADSELAENLGRMHAGLAAVRYFQADVTDVAAVGHAVAEIREAFGPVTAILHGAGRNDPAALSALTIDDVLRTFAPKVDGLRAVLDAVEPGSLRLLVTFGSIIGRAGLRGQADYAAANDWLAEETRRVTRTHPGCRALCLEWSVWSGVGMGERLAVVESLMRDGVTPITPDQGTRLLRGLLADPATPPVVLVSGRADGLDTLRYERPELPLLRFVERPLVHYPGVELITEAELTSSSDPYLDDHELDGNLLFPAVIGMEAMAQTACALVGTVTAPVIENAEFARPIVVPVDGATTIRVAALVKGEGTVEVVIRSGETDFAADHFRATLRFGTPLAMGGGPEPASAGLPAVTLDPARDLYDDVLFQGPRFQRLLRYRRVVARHAEADVATSDAIDWFGRFLPGGLVLGDPGARDALMHGLQVCVPDATLLPVGVERIQLTGTVADGKQELTFVGSERHHDGDLYVYDISVRDRSGDVIERWEGLRLRAVRHTDGSGPWAPALLGSLLERRLADSLGAPADVTVAVEPGAGRQRRENTAVALGRALGRVVNPRYRPDGRPTLDGGLTVSAAHGAGLTLAAAGPGTVSCDVASVVPHTATEWTELLGRHAALRDLLVAETGYSPDAAATRVWCAAECLQKAGEVTPHAPLTLLPRIRDGWSVLASGDLRIATFLTTLHDEPNPVVLAVLTKGGR